MGKDVCHVCSKPANQRCCGCLQIFYCSREHQKVDWRLHKKRCKPYQIRVNAALGKHLVATRDIKRGEVILKEAALVSGPPLITAPVCLGCYKVLTDTDHVLCPYGCGWPLCSDACAGAQSPHHAECRLTRDLRGDKVTIRNFQITHPTYQCVTVLRCLENKVSNPATWVKLIALEAHMEKRLETGKAEVSVAHFLTRYFKMEDIFTEKEILQMCGVIQVNGHEVPVSDPCHVAIYDEISLIEHNCLPNCSKSFTARGEILVKASRDITREEHVTISYTDTLWGTANRRHHLAESKFFSCQCSRCVDATELGTYFSAIRCTHSGCHGFALPVDPLQDAAWRCGQCHLEISMDQVQEVTERVGQRLTAMKKGVIKECVKFLDEISGHVLHQNHYYLTDVRLALSQLIGQQGGGVATLSDDLLHFKTSLCTQLLDLANTLFPADIRVRGILNFELHSVIAEEGRRKANRGEIDPSDLTARLKESKRLLEEAIFLLQHEPEVLPEGKIAIQAKKNLLDLNVLLQRIHITHGDSPM